MKYLDKFEPIFFTPPSGDTKRPRKLYKGSKGGDGGAAARQAAEDSRVAAAIQHINEVFGVSAATPEAVDQNQFMIDAPVPVKTQPASFGMAGRSNQAQYPTGMGSIFNLNAKTPVKKILDTGRYNSAVQASRAKADRLNATAGDRENLYSKIGTDATNTALLDLDKERGVTERELNFMLARAGLSGGSRDIDVNRDVLDTYNQGVLKASNIGLSTANNARSSDDKTRVNLINSIRSGLDAGSATQQAYEGLRNNAKLAQDDANVASLDGFFDTLKNQQQAAAYNAGLNGANPVQQYKTTPATSAVNGDKGRSGSY
jgi:hypothetical protein